MMINNVPNNIGDLDNLIANERRLYNERTEQLQTFKNRYNNENENKEPLYDDVQETYKNISPSYYNLMNILENAKRDVKANEEIRNNLREAKQEVERQIKQRARNISVQILNDYMVGLERGLTEFKQRVLNIENCKKDENGFRLMDECERAKNICDDMVRNYLRKMSLLLTLVNRDVNNDNTKKQGKLKYVEID